MFRFFAAVIVAVSLLSAPGAMAGITLYEQDDFTLDVFGKMRVRANNYGNFDMDSSSNQDRENDFLDTRASIGFNAKYGSITAHLALDVAGDDFTDGVLMGNDNPGLQRKWETKVQELYLKWKGPVIVQMGRQQGHLGNGFVAHVKRDAVKVVKKIDKLALVAVWVKGGEGRTQDRGVSGVSDTNGDANGNQSGVPINAVGGEDEELDAYIGIATYKLENGKIQIFKAWQADSTAADRLPQKDFTDINVSYKAMDGKLKLTGEYVKLSGSSPANNTAQGTAEGERAVFDAWMYYADANYKTDYGTWGFATGAGSGDNDNTDKRIGGFQALFIDETHFTYNNLFADDIWGYDLNKAGSLNTTSTGVNNVTWYKLYGIFPNVFMEGLTIAPSYSVMNTTTTPSGISGSNYGSEIDINVDFRISKMANLFLKTAYFMPGSYFKDNEIGGKKRSDAASKIEAGMAVAF